MNPFFRTMPAVSGLKINPALLGQVKQVMSMLSAAGDPEKALQMVSANNPAMSLVAKVVGNRDPKTVFYELCKENGINPDDILSQLK